MTDVLTIEQAEDLAARTIRRIENFPISPDMDLDPWHADADVERIASDLEGLRGHAPDLTSGECRSCLGGTGDYEGFPCADVTRYSAGLIRTAALYGVTL